MRNAAISLDRNSPLPLYEQIKRRVLSMILGWQQDSERFHTDQELSEQFGVSRMTVRQAVQDLVKEGYLRRVRGSGTFVCAPKVDERFSTAMDFIDQWATRGRALELRVLHCAIEPCDARAAQQLDIKTGDPVWSILRLRTVKHVPISIDYRYIPVCVIKTINAKQVAAGSLLDLVGQYVDLSYGELKVEAESVQPEHADYLGLMPDDPILTRHLVYYDLNDRPVMSGISHYRADQVRYSIRVPLKKERQANASVIDALEFRSHPEMRKSQLKRR
ncbi:GntR family transcriptional regulator [Paralcaligenes sp. KSB-10]|uniref:GntR family transcriptional regulator n=1 Tax=Paralcaligenes sp. KSB-10 TaxID=2901142 RepID=UPI001E594335|nr:GntR family transcriptional regulator [Paralcaligenes sp. KSB-10]UHL64687.1 GntR family transcriptional regulator [Paralcaligenes sp. KSB-10]